jgi:hypothetical protein
MFGNEKYSERREAVMAGAEPENQRMSFDTLFAWYIYYAALWYGI